MRALLWLLILTSPMLATDKKKLSDAVAAVDANLKTSAGKQYDANLSKEFSARYATTIRQCRQQAGSDRIPAPFDLLMRVDEAGNVIEVLAYPEAGMAKCAANALQRAKFSPPPHADYWFNIHLQFKK